MVYWKSQAAWWTWWCKRCVLSHCFDPWAGCGPVILSPENDCTSSSYTPQNPWKTKPHLTVARWEQEKKEQSLCLRLRSFEIFETQRNTELCLKVTVIGPRSKPQNVTKPPRLDRLDSYLGEFIMIWPITEISLTSQAWLILREVGLLGESSELQKQKVCRLYKYWQKG